jgi:hypothetical protein
MRWFMTHRDEVALRAEIIGLADENHAAEIQRLTDGFNAERDRWRDDRREEMARLTDPHGPYVAHLQNEVEFWRAQFLHERQRAEVSVDQRLSERGLGPVTLPPRPTTMEETERLQRETDKLTDMFRNPELAMMGMTDGVDH